MVFERLGILVGGWIGMFKEIKGWKDWDKGSQRIVLFEIGLFFLGLILACFLPFMVQCTIVAILYAIGIGSFLNSEYGHSGFKTAVWASTMFFHPIIIGFLITDFLKLIF